MPPSRLTSLRETSVSETRAVPIRNDETVATPALKRRSRDRREPFTVASSFATDGSMLMLPMLSPESEAKTAPAPGGVAAPARRALVASSTTVATVSTTTTSATNRRRRTCASLLAVRRRRRRGARMSSLVSWAASTSSLSRHASPRSAGLGTTGLIAPHRAPSHTLSEAERYPATVSAACGCNESSKSARRPSGAVRRGERRGGAERRGRRRGGARPGSAPPPHAGLGRGLAKLICREGT